MEDVQVTEITEETQVEPTEAQIQEENEVVESATTEPKPETEYTKNVVKRINKITKEKYALLDENARLKAQIGDGKQPDAPNPVDYTDQYGGMDYSKWNADMQKYQADYYAYQKGKETQAPEIQDDVTRFNDDGTAIAESNPDFWDVVSQPIYEQTLTKVLYDSEKSAELTYFLGKNRGELVRINSLPVNQMVDAVAELENRFQKKSKIVSSAPAPLSPVEDGKGTPTTEPKTDDEWYAREEKRRLERIKQGM